jgi:cell fate regulator YaaT (PSP1 superfamily)
MACSTCSSDSGVPNGCKSNGSCGTGGCNSYNVFDWLSNMALPAGEEAFPWVEVRFKNGRKDFYKLTEPLSLHAGEAVTVSTAHGGHDVGTISVTGELVRIQMRKAQADPQQENPLVIYRKSSQRDLDRWKEARDRENDLMLRARQMATANHLEMKISDVECQGDGARATFYYTADARVDFRALIREMSGAFGLRVEMRQVGARQEAGRLGGIGSCGRELCCSTWLKDYRSVSTSAARYQQLSLNPTKLAGNCGKLKCCLNYELDQYAEALKAFPKSQRVKTKKGKAEVQKMDILTGMVWLAYKDEPGRWVAMRAEDFSDMVAMNQKGEEPASLEEKELVIAPVASEPEMIQPEEDSLTRFDRPKGEGGNRRNRKRGGKNRSRSAQGNRSGKPQNASRSENGSKTK